MSASIKDPRVEDFARLIAEVDEWRGKTFEEKKADATRLSTMVLQLMSDTGMDAPIEMEVHLEMTGGAENYELKSDTPSFYQMAARGTAAIIHLFGSMGLREPKLRNLIVSDFLALSKGDCPQLPWAIVKANRKQDRQDLDKQIKGLAISMAVWRASYNGNRIGWPKVFTGMFKGVFAERTLDRVRTATLDRDEYLLIKSAAKRRRAIDDAKVTGAEAEPMTPEELNAELRLAQHDQERVYAALKEASKNNWKLISPVVEKIRAAGL